MELAGVGIWSTELRRHADAGAVADAAAELEQLGYTMLWLPGGDPDTLFNRVSEVLAATSRVTVATGILNIWQHDPQAVAAERAQLYDAYGGRFLLGLGVSHAPLVDRDEPGRYKRPLSAMEAFLDSLDAAAPPVLPEDRVLAALGPKMLRLAAERSLGAHPYLVTPEHTRGARQILGPERLLAPEQGVLLETDPARARAAARSALEMYLRLPNYTNNMRRLGFGDADFEGGGSDRLVDALVAWGDAEDVEERVRQHRQVGADHVCVQVLPSGGDGLPRAAWRELAHVLVPAAA
jgi:probable F420-dependent oxidoreductase